MLSQTTAFLTRSIRQESRLLSHHLIRSAMVLLMLYLLGLQVLESPRLGASGLTLIGNVMRCCYWCLTLLGVMYFSVAITEEKEEDTLPLLRMTGVRNVTLLLGKSLPRLAVVVLLIMISAPFLMLAVTLGGVVSGQIISSILGLMCYAFCLSQMGLFSSTLSQNSSRAVSGTFALWLLLEFGSWIFWLMASACAEWNLKSLSQLSFWIAGVWWERTMWQASDAYLMVERGEAIWHSQMTFHLVIGVVFFGLSLLLFERFNQRAIAQGAASAVNINRGVASKTNSLRSLRCWDAALEWKSWQFIAGGSFWFWIWTISLPVMSVSLVVTISMMVGEFPPVEIYGVTMMVVGVAALAILLARLFGNLFNREIYDKTLVSLCMLPRARSLILWRMVAGVAPFLIAPVFCFGIGTLWMMACDSRVIINTFELLAEPWFWATLSWVVVTVHLGVLFSVYFRHGGMLVAVAICFFILPFMGGMMMAVMSFAFRGGRSVDDFFQYAVPVFAILAHVVICAVLQKLILNRVEQLAAT